MWRDGPPSKPVLCNACGLRWITRGTLDFYVAKHKRNSVKTQENNNLYDGPHTKGNYSSTLYFYLQLGLCNATKPNCKVTLFAIIGSEYTSWVC